MDSREGQFSGPRKQGPAALRHIAHELIALANQQEFDGKDTRRAAKELDTTMDKLLDSITRIKKITAKICL